MKFRIEMQRKHTLESDIFFKKASIDVTADTETLAKVKALDIAVNDQLKVFGDKIEVYEVSILKVEICGDSLENQQT